MSQQRQLRIGCCVRQCVYNFSKILIISVKDTKNLMSYLKNPQFFFLRIFLTFILCIYRNFRYNFAIIWPVPAFPLSFISVPSKFYKVYEGKGGGVKEYLLDFYGSAASCIKKIRRQKFVSIPETYLVRMSTYCIWQEVLVPLKNCDILMF